MRFIEVIGGWINRHFSNEEAIYLIVLLMVGIGGLLLFGSFLAPVLTGLVIAFLLQGLVQRLMAWRVPELMAVSVSLLVFIGTVTALAIFVFPLLWRQLRAMAGALPGVIDVVREGLTDLTRRFPEFVTEAQVSSWLDQAGKEAGALGGTVLEAMVTQVPSLVGLLIYLILVPISVFFFLKDRRELVAWFTSLLPAERPLLNSVGQEMMRQLGNYARGKVIEILVVGAATFIAFSLLGLNYAALLGVLVGLSVLIPFVGAAVVTVPVLIVALIQFGWSWDTALVMSVYGVIQFLDGNVLVPVLFSEVVDLHPITIIVAVLAFGGLWGVWGVFFAIPLATLVKAVYEAWPEAVAEAEAQGPPPDPVEDPADIASAGG